MTSKTNPQRKSSLAVTLALSALALAAQACGGESDPMSSVEADSEMPEMPIDPFLEVVGKADIDHGTGAYQPPPQPVDQEIEQRIFVAFLSGGQEVPPVATRAEGAMALILDRRGRRLHYLIRHDVE